MPTAAPRQIVSAFLLLVIASPAIAAGPDGVYDEDPPTFSAGTRAPLSAREAELRTTLEKRKARRARDRVAYQRATPQANAMLAAATSPRPPRAALFSLPPNSALQAVNFGGSAGLGNSGAFYQAAGQSGSTGVYSTGGTGQCARR